MANEDIRRFSLAELRTKRDRRETETREDAPVYPVDEAFWERAKLIEPRRAKVHTGLRIDADVLEFFKAQGKGWQTRINAVLRSYMEHAGR